MIPKTDTMNIPRCREGNACTWSNCRYGHTKCSFGSKCRDIAHCKFDHRDPTKLKLFVDRVDVDTEAALMENFLTKGLSPISPGFYDKNTMSSVNRAILYRSLNLANIPYEKLEGVIKIVYSETDGDLVKKDFVEYEGYVLSAKDYVDVWTEWNTEMRNAFKVKGYGEW